MKKSKLPPRPAENFWISSIQSLVEIEKRHRDAGFPAVSELAVRRRFCQFVRFLQEHGLTARELLHGTDMPIDLDLYNDDLTDSGFLFVQRYHDRWISRLYKDRGNDAEAKLLAKWLREFASDGTAGAAN